MDKKKKKIKLNSLIVFIVVFIIIVVAIVLIANTALKSKEQGTSEQGGENTNTVSYVAELEEGVKVNRSTAFNTTKVLNGLTISNIQLSTRSGMTTFLAEVKNDTDTQTSVRVVEVTLLTQDGKEMVKLTGVINSLAPGATTELNIATTSDYIEAYDFTIVEK